MKNNKVLILVPNETARGGITNYYQTLRKHFPESIIYLYRGSRKYPYRSNFICETIRLINDYIIFIYYLIAYPIKIVQTTTSFSKRSIYRDSIYILLAKLFNKKTIVFYRGWDKQFADNAHKKFFYQQLFLKANASIVLSNYQKEKLVFWGYKNKIFKETTVVDNDLFRGWSINTIINKFESLKANSPITLLFLSRVEITKGVFELINAFDKLRNVYPVNLVIAGDGTAEKDLQKLVRDRGIENVSFKGFVSGENKAMLLNSSHIFVFPSYSEGMPNAVLEAMYAGLPVITTRVGGLVDFFQDGINGFFIEKKSEMSIIEQCSKLILSKKISQEMALYNHYYARDHFLASDISKRIIGIFQELI